MAETGFLLTFYTESHDTEKKNIWVCDNLAVVTFGLEDITYL